MSNALFSMNALQGWASSWMHSKRPHPESRNARPLAHRAYRHTGAVRISPITNAQWAVGAGMLIATAATAYYYPEIFFSHEKPL